MLGTASDSADSLYIQWPTAVAGTAASIILCCQSATNITLNINLITVVSYDYVSVLIVFNNIMSQDNRENVRVIFNEGFIYVCHFCGKLSNDADDLTDHLDDDHEDECYDDIDLEGPLFKTRKLKYYHKQLTANSIDINKVSIVDLIELPIQELTDILQTLTLKQKELCL